MKDSQTTTWLHAGYWLWTCIKLLSLNPTLLWTVVSHIEIYQIVKVSWKWLFYLGTHLPLANERNTQSLDLNILVVTEKLVEAMFQLNEYIMFFTHQDSKVHRHYMLSKKGLIFTLWTICFILIENNVLTSFYHFWYSELHSCSMRLNYFFYTFYLIPTLTRTIFRGRFKCHQDEESAGSTTHKSLRMSKLYTSSSEQETETM